MPGSTCYKLAEPSLTLPKSVAWSKLPKQTLTHCSMLSCPSVRFSVSIAPKRSLSGSLVKRMSPQHPTTPRLRALPLQPKLAWCTGPLLTLHMASSPRVSLLPRSPLGGLFPEPPHFGMKMSSSSGPLLEVSESKND